MIRMNENWAICHDNGVAGQRGTSDGFTSEAQAVKFAAEMASHGITIYEVWRVE